MTVVATLGKPFLGGQKPFDSILPRTHPKIRQIPELRTANIPLTKRHRNVSHIAFDSGPLTIPETATASVPAANDPVVGALFTLAVAALSVVTIGVAYLSFASWNDSRQEKEDQLRNNGTRSSNGNMNASRTNKDGAKKKAQAPKTSKGFGKK